MNEVTQTDPLFTLFTLNIGNEWVHYINLIKSLKGLSWMDLNVVIFIFLFSFFSIQIINDDINQNIFCKKSIFHFISPLRSPSCCRTSRRPRRPGPWRPLTWSWRSPGKAGCSGMRLEKKYSTQQRFYWMFKIPAADTPAVPIDTFTCRITFKEN